MLLGNRALSVDLAALGRWFRSSEWPDCAFVVLCLLWFVPFRTWWQDYTNLGATWLVLFAPVGMMVPLWTALRLRVSDPQLRRRLVWQGAVVALVWATALVVCFVFPCLPPSRPENAWYFANPLAALIACIVASEAYYRWAFQGTLDSMRRVWREAPAVGISSGSALPYAPRVLWWALALLFWTTYVLLPVIPLIRVQAW